MSQTKLKQKPYYHSPYKKFRCHKPGPKTPRAKLKLMTLPLKMKPKTQQSKTKLAAPIALRQSAHGAQTTPVTPTSAAKKTPSERRAARWFADQAAKLPKLAAVAKVTIPQELQQRRVDRLQKQHALLAEQEYKHKTAQGTLDLYFLARQLAEAKKYQVTAKVASKSAANFKAAMSDTAGVQVADTLKYLQNLGKEDLKHQDLKSQLAAQVDMVEHLSKQWRAARSEAWGANQRLGEMQHKIDEFDDQRSRHRRILAAVVKRGTGWQARSNQFEAQVRLQQEEIDKHNRLYALGQVLIKGMQDYIGKLEAIVPESQRPSKITSEEGMSVLMMHHQPQPKGYVIAPYQVRLRQADPTYYNTMPAKIQQPSPTHEYEVEVSHPLLPEQQCLQKRPNARTRAQARVILQKAVKAFTETIKNVGAVIVTSDGCGVNPSHMVRWLEIVDDTRLRASVRILPGSIGLTPLRYRARGESKIKMWRRPNPHLRVPNLSNCPICFKPGQRLWETLIIRPGDNADNAKRAVRMGCVACDAIWTAPLE